MPRPNGKIPYEIFGHSTGEAVTNEVQRHFHSQYCRFINGECKKFRKSEPRTKIGSCVLGYRGNLSEDYEPLIICPYRYEEDIIFRTVENLYFPGQTVLWVQEVQLGDRGSIDYVAIVLGEDAEIVDFLCVEFQAGGTTGTPWAGIRHFIENHTIEGIPTLNYGINWANEYIKTLMQQINKKGSLIDSWGRKIVIIIQDVGMNYITSQGSGIENFNQDHPVHFLPFRLDYVGKRWTLVPSDTKYSADMDGIREALMSAGEAQITESVFEERILAKGRRDGVL